MLAGVLNIILKILGTLLEIYLFLVVYDGLNKTDRIS